MSVSGRIDRALSLPEIIRAKVRTSLYRRTSHLARTARVVGGGHILNPAGKREAVRVGDHTILRGELFVFPHAGQITIGEWCFIGEDSYIWSSASVAIGDRVLISHGVNIHDTNGHPLMADARHEQFRSIAYLGHPREISTIGAKSIVIEDDAWIGLGAIIMKGVRIGARSIVAAGSVVLDDVPPDVTVAGNPARVVKKGEEAERHISAGDLAEWPQYQD